MTLLFAVLKVLGMGSQGSHAPSLYCLQQFQSVIIEIECALIAVWLLLTAFLRSRAFSGMISELLRNGLHRKHCTPLSSDPFAVESCRHVQSLTQLSSCPDQKCWHVPHCLGDFLLVLP